MADHLYKVSQHTLDRNASDLRISRTDSFQTLRLYEVLDLFEHVWRLGEAAYHEHILREVSYITLLITFAYLDVDLTASSALLHLIQ